MSTKFYLSASTAGVVTPVADGIWDYTSESVVRSATCAPDETTLAAGTVIGPWTPGQAAQDRVYVTELTLSYNQTITGTISAQALALEVDSADNISTRFETYVASGDGTTVRGTLLAIGSHGTGTELNTSMQNASFASAASVSTVNALAGDRLVFAFGYSDFSGTTPEAQATGGSSHGNAIDLPVNESTTTSYNPWVEFSQDLVFELSPTAIYDGNISSTVGLSGSAVTSFSKTSGSTNVIFTQATTRT